VYASALLVLIHCQYSFVCVKKGGNPLKVAAMILSSLSLSLQNRHSHPVCELTVSPQTLPPHSPPAKRKSRSGFTLIELSIVLVIIGLLVGGVLVGRELITAAEMRKDISLFEKIDAAVNTFRGKYDCLPGDCAKATSFFTGARDGNGDGNIDGVDYGCGPLPGRWCIGSFTGNTEVTYAMDDLARAGLTSAQPVNYGTLDDDIWAYKPFVKTSQGSYILMVTLPALGKSFYRVWNNCNAGPYYIACMGSGRYTPMQVYQIDSKMDDGLSRSGRVIGGAGGLNYLSTAGEFGGWDGNIFNCANSINMDSGVAPYPYTNSNDPSARCGFNVQASF